VRPAACILAEVDGEVALAVLLVGGQCGAGNRRQDLRADCGQLRALCRTRRRIHDKLLLQRAPRRVVAHEERTVLAHHRIHRPRPRDVIAPAGGPSGDRDHQLAGGTQAAQCRVGRGRELPMGGDRVVDVGKNAADRASCRGRHRGQRLQACR